MSGLRQACRESQGGAFSNRVLEHLLVRAELDHLEPPIIRVVDVTATGPRTLLRPVTVAPVAHAPPRYRSAGRARHRRPRRAPPSVFGGGFCAGGPLAALVTITIRRGMSVTGAGHHRAASPVEDPSQAVISWALRSAPGRVPHSHHASTGTMHRRALAASRKVGLPAAVSARACREQLPFGEPRRGESPPRDRRLGSGRPGHDGQRLCAGAVLTWLEQGCLVVQRCVVGAR